MREKSKVICEWLFDPEEMAKPDFDPKDAVELFHRVNLQDFEACQVVSRKYELKVL